MNTTVAEDAGIATPLPHVPKRGRPQVPIFNPADNPENPIAFGHYFHCPGAQITFIGDIWDWPRDEDNRLIMGDGVQRELTVDAWTVAELICGPESMGPRGFIVLQGDEEQQRTAMKGAREKWLRVKSDEVDAIIESFEVMAAEYVRLSPNPSRPGLRPGKRVQAAFKWRQDHEAELQEYNIEVPTPYTPSREVQPPALLRAGDDEEKRKAIIAGSTLLGRAMERGLELSIGDTKGLVAGDADVIADVESRLSVTPQRRPGGNSKGRARQPEVVPPAEPEPPTEPPKDATA